MLFNAAIFLIQRGLAFRGRSNRDGMNRGNFSDLYQLLVKFSEEESSL